MLAPRRHKQRRAPWTPAVLPAVFLALAVCVCRLDVAHAALGAFEGDCSMRTAVYADEALVFVAVADESTLAPPAFGEDTVGGTAFTPAAESAPHVLPRAPLDLSMFTNASGVLDGVSVEMDATAAHTTALLSRLVLRDSSERVVLDLALEEGQQTRFTSRGDTAVNRLVSDVLATAPPAGDVTDVTYIELYRSGPTALTAFPPSSVWFRLSSLRFRRQCKDCGAAIDGATRDNTVVALADTPTQEVPLVAVVTTLSSTSTDLSAAVDPGCRCLPPSVDADASPTLSVDVLLRDQFVWPSRAQLVHAPTGKVLLDVPLPRIEDNAAIGTWTTITTAVPGDANVWRVWNTSVADGDGPRPDWSDVRLVMSRDQLFGVPAAEQVPVVRNPRLYTAASSMADAQVAHVLSAPTTLTLAPRSFGLHLPGSLDVDAALPSRLSALRAFVDGVHISELYAGDCDGDCSRISLVLRTTHAHLLDVVRLIDSAGRFVDIKLPETATAAAALSPATALTVLAPLRSDSVFVNTRAFEWDDIVSVAFQLPRGATDDDVDAVNADGGIVVSFLRLVRPLRVGLTFTSSTYLADDDACDPVVGSFDASPYARTGAARFAHCRPCCCFVSSPVTPGEVVCMEQGDFASDVMPFSPPHDQCVVCNRDASAVVLSPAVTLLQILADTGDLPSTIACDDGELCTYSDECSDAGTCGGTLYTSCLISDFWDNDPSKNCEMCDGTGPYSASAGCVPRDGHYVHVSQDGNRTCGCSIDGEVYAHLAVNPQAPCQRCDVTVSNTAWTDAPNGVACDPRQQSDWANYAVQACTFGHACDAGKCVGASYTCPPLQACEVADSAFPHVCDLTGPASESGGCRRRNMNAGVECAPAVHGCMLASYCSGSTGSCPPQDVLAGIIYDDADKGLGIMLPDGSPVDTQYPVVPSLEAVTASFRAFRVQCGTLQVRLGLVTDGPCDVSRIDDTIAGGWGPGFAPAPRGSWTVLTHDVSLRVEEDESGDALLRPAALSDEASPGIVLLDVPDGDLSAAAGTQTGLTQVVEPFLDIFVTVEHPSLIAAIDVVDTTGTTLRFYASPSRVTGAPTLLVASPRPAIDNLSEDDAALQWDSIAGVRFIVEANVTASPVPNSTTIAQIHSMRLRTRAQAPPCPFRNIVDPASGALSLAVGHTPRAATSATYAATLFPPVDIASFFDAAASAWLSDTVVVMDIAVDAPDMVPSTLTLRGAGGTVVVPLTDVNAATPGVFHVSQPLRGYQANGTFDATALQAIHAIDVSVVPRAADSGVDVAAAVAAAPSASLLSLYVTDASSSCAHAMHSLRRGSVYMLDASASATDGVRLARTAGAATLFAEGDSDEETDMDLSSLGIDIAGLADLYDPSCECFPDAVLQLTTQAASVWHRLARIDLLDSSTGAGLSITALPPPVDAAAAPSTPYTVSVHLGDADAVSMLGSPTTATWDALDVVRAWSTAASSIAHDDRSDGDIVLLSLRMVPAQLACVQSPSASSGLGASSQGLDVTGAAATAVLAADGTQGAATTTLTLVTEDSVMDDGATTLSHVEWDGENGVDTVSLALTTATRSDGMPVVAVASLAFNVSSEAFNVSSDAHNASDAGQSVAMPASVITVRDAVRGNGMWTLRLPVNVSFAAMVTNFVPDVGVVLYAVGSSLHPELSVGGQPAVPRMGGADAVVVAMALDDGEVLAAHAFGSTAGDDTWNSVMPHPDTVAHATGIVMGGSTTEATAATSNAFPLAASRCVVAVIDGVATDVSASTQAADRWTVLGFDQSTAECAVSSLAMLGDGDSVVVAGTYAGARLQVYGNAAVGTLAAPPASSSAGFVAIVSASTGAVTWLGLSDTQFADTAGVSAEQVVATTADVLGGVMITATSWSSLDDAAVITCRLAASPDSTPLWSRVLDASAVHVVATPDGTVAVTAAANDAGAGLVVDGTAVLQGHSDASGVQRAALLRLDAATGTMTGAEWIHDAEDVRASTVAAAVAPVTGGYGASSSAVVVAGAATAGALTAGSPIAAVFPAPWERDDDHDAAFLAWFDPVVTRQAATAPAVLHRASDDVDSAAHAVAITHSAAVLGGVAGDAGFVRVVRGSAAAPALPVDAAWGVTGTSAVTAATPISTAQVVVVGTVRGVMDGLLLHPQDSDAAAVPLDFPATTERFYAVVNVEDGSVAAVAAAPGNTGGDDYSAAAAYHGDTETLFEVGYTSADGLFACPLGATCDTGRVAVSTVTSGGMLTMDTAQTAVHSIGGDGVSARVQDVRIHDSTVVVSGWYRGVAGDATSDGGSPTSAYGGGIDVAAQTVAELQVPRSLTAQPAASGQDDTVSATVSPHGYVAGFSAVYQLPSGDLQSLTTLRADDVDVTVRTAARAGHVVATAATVGAASAPSTLVRDTWTAAGTQEAEPLLSLPATNATRVFVAATAIAAPTAAPVWTAVVHASGEIGMAVTACTEAGDAVALVGTLDVPPASTVLVNDEAVLTVSSNAAQVGRQWLLAVPLSGTASTATVASLSTASVFGSASDVMHAASYDVMRGAVLVAGGTQGAMWRAASDTVATPTPVSGSSQLSTSAGSQDATLAALPIAASAQQSASGRPWPPSIGTHAVSTVTSAAQVFLTNADGDAEAEAAIAFGTGVSVGRLHTVTVGHFKGHMDFGNGVAATSAGQLGDAAHAFDGFAVGHVSSSGTAARVLKLEVEGGSPGHDHRFHGAAASADGRSHYVVGHVTSAAADGRVTLGADSQSVPGDGGRDGIVARLDDDTLTVAWLEDVGATTAADDVLLAVAVHESVSAVVVGFASGVAATYARSSIYSGSIGSRTLATVFALAPLTGSPQWGTAFGTTTTTGAAFATAVAWSPAGDVVFVGGTFHSGALEVGATTLEHAAGGVLFDDRHTAFIAALSGTDGSVLWATAAVASHPSAAMFSVVRGLSATSAAVVAAGDFLHTADGAGGASRLSFGSSDVFAAEPANTTNAVAAEDRVHAFVVTLDAATGSTTRLHVPTCDACRAGGVAAVGSHVAATFSFAGPMTIASADAAATQATTLSDAVHPMAQRGALVLLDGTGGIALVQSLGIDNGGGHVVPAAVAHQLQAGLLGVAGWRSGGVSFSDARTGTTPSLGGRVVAAPDTPAASTIDMQPFVAWFDWHATAPATRTATRAHAVTQAAAVTAPAAGADAITHAVSGVGAHVSIVAMTLAAGASVPAVNGTSNDVNTTAVLVASATRGARATLWTAPWVAERDVDNTAVAADASPSGDRVCVVGSVSAPATTVGGVDGVEVAGGRGGMTDAVVACFAASFDAENATASPSQVASSPQPLWAAALGSPAYDAATAVHVTAGRVWLAATTRGDMHVAGSSVSGGSAPTSALCVVAVLDSRTGAEVGGFLVGDDGNAGDSCALNAITGPTVDDSYVCVGGHFTGDSLVLGGGSVTLTAPTWQRSSTGFVACYDAEVGGTTDYTLRWASVVSSSHPTWAAATLMSTVTGLVWVDDASDAVAPAARRLYVSGHYHGPDIAWGALSTNLTINTAASLTASAAGEQPSAAFVAVFDAYPTAPLTTSADPQWLTSIPTSQRGGCVSTGPSDLQAGAVVVPMVATASVPLSPAVADASHASPTAAAAGSSMIALVTVDAASGRVRRATVLSDADGVGTSASGAPVVPTVGAVSLASSPPAQRGARALHSLFATVVVQAGGLSSSAQLLPELGLRVDKALACDTCASVATVDLGPSPRALRGSGVPVHSGGLQSLAKPWDVDTQLLFDVSCSITGAAITSGTWTTAPGGAGTGITFEVTPASVTAQAGAEAGTWIAVSATLRQMTHVDNAHVYGIGGGDAWSHLRHLAFDTAPLRHEGAVWRVRRVRVAPVDNDGCVAVGEVALTTLPMDVTAAPASSPYLMHDDASSLLRVPADVSTLVDPACNCLAGATLTWQQQFAGTADAATATTVSAVRLASASGAGVTSTAPVVYSNATVADGSAWREASVTFMLPDHQGVHEVDWQRLTTLQLVTAATDTTGTAVISNVRLVRDAPPTQALLHPYPTSSNNTITVTRSGLNLTNGATYRAITYETNMFGDDSPPTCSPSFVVDNTPPIVTDATVLDVLPVLGAAHEDVSFTSNARLRVGWSGTFTEPDSSPDNLMLFRIVSVTSQSPMGDAVPDASTDGIVFAAASTGYVTTPELELDDGETYYTHLGVCNRAKLCTMVVSSGVTYDASPPTSPALHVLPSADAAVDVASLPPPGVVTQSNTTAIHAVWAPFSDPHTWVQDIRVGVGTSGFGADVHALELVDNTTTAYTFTGTELTPGQVYYVVWSVTNAAGAVGTYRSEPVYVDVTPPSVTYVVDITPVEVQGVESYYMQSETDAGDIDLSNGAVVRAKFMCQDLQSVAGGSRGNMTYRWRVCTTSACNDGDNVTAWMDVGTTPRGSVATPALDLTDTTVYAHVECTNPVGLQASGSSDGFTVDMTPPDNSTAIVWEVDPDAALSGADVTADVDFISGTKLVAAWTPFSVATANSPPIVMYSWGIGSTPGATDVYGPVAVALATEASVSSANATLVQNATYYVTVSAVTASGASSYIVSDGVTVDGVPPSPQARLVTPVAVANATARCAAHLQCVELTPGASVGDGIVAVAATATASSQALSLYVAAIGATRAPVGAVQYGLSTCGDGLLDLNTLPLQRAESATASRIEVTGLQLFHGQEYCGIVVVTTAAGLTGVASTQGVKVDLTPPISVHVHEGTSHVTDTDYVAGNTVNVTYACTDLESGIHHAEVRVARVDADTGTELAEALPWTEAPVEDATSPDGGATLQGSVAATPDAGLQHGASYVTTLRCVNNAGAYSERDSDGFSVDNTAPSSDGAVVDHSQQHGVSVSVQGDGTAIAASWYGFEDDESPVVMFSWSVGTAPHAADVVAVTRLGAATTARATDLQLQDGVTYYVTVYAANAAGLTTATASAGVTVDMTPPPAVAVAVVPPTVGGSSAWLGSTDTVHLAWADGGSNITYRWAIGTSAHGQQVLPLSAPTTATSVNATGLRLTAGSEYYATVVSTDAVGLHTASVSTPFRIDVTPPTGTVVNGLAMDAPTTMTSDDSGVSCAWSFDDDVAGTAGSGVTSYRVGVGSIAGSVADVVPFASYGAGVTQATLTPAAALPHGGTYHCVVHAVDAAGNVGEAWSKGVRVDTTGPVAGTVVDVVPVDTAAAVVGDVDVDWHNDMYALAAAWRGWYDAESGVHGLQWAISTTPEWSAATSVMDWTWVASHASHARHAFAAGILHANTTYYVSVRAMNGVGEWTTATSDGVTLLPLETASGSAHGVAALDVAASLAYIPSSTSSHNGSWCACSATAATVMNASYDPTTGSCACGPHTYLDPATGACASCPVGTCKPGRGNAMALCDAAMCGVDDDVVPVPPSSPSALGLTSCGAAGSLKVQRPSDGMCVCPPGTEERPGGMCVSCEDGWANPWYAAPATCQPCWDTVVPDVSLWVSWDAAQVLDVAGDAVRHVVVGVGTGRGAMRWTKTVNVSDEGVEFHSHDPPPRVPFTHGSVLYVRVQAVVETGGNTGTQLVVLSSDTVATPTVNLKPPSRGTVFDGAGGLADGSVVSSATEMSAAWFGFDSDVVDAAADVMVAFGSSGAASDDVVPWTLVAAPEMGNVTATAAAPVAQGTVVTASVRVMTAGGWVMASSDGAVVQSSIPTGIVKVLSVAYMATPPPTTLQGVSHQTRQPDASTLAFAWHFDVRSAGATEAAAAALAAVPLTYTWSIEVDGSGVVAASGGVTGDGFTWQALTGLALEHGSTYVVRVNATNPRGVLGMAVSPTFTVDWTPPAVASFAVLREDAATATLVEHAVNDTDDRLWQSSPSTVGVQWQCLDAELTVTDAVVAVGGVQGGDAVVAASTFDAADGAATLTGLQLQHGGCYEVQLACADGNVWGAFATVDMPLCVDTTPPLVVPATVHPYTQQLLELSPDGAVGTVATNESLVLRVVAAADDLHDRDHSEAEAAVAAFMEPYVMDAVTNAQASEPDMPLYVAAGGDVPAVLTVSATDDESTVVYMDVAWSTAATPMAGGVDGTALTPLTALDQELVDQIGAIVSSHNVTYTELHTAAAGGDADAVVTVFGHVRAINSAGVPVTGVTAAAVLVPTAPVLSSVATGASRVAVVDGLATLSASWEVAPGAAPLAGVAWRVRHAADTPDGSLALANNTASEAVELEWLGTATSVVREDVTLEHGATYAIEITACSMALLCTTETVEIVADATAPEPVIVYPGMTDSALETECTANASSTLCVLPTPPVLPAGGMVEAGNVSWAPFVDGESGVVSYTVVLGTSSQGSQLGAGVELPAHVTTVPLADLVDVSDTAVAQLLYHEAQLYATVTAENGAGLRSTAAAIAVAVNEQPPSAHRVWFAGSAVRAPLAVADDNVTLPAADGIAVVPTTEDSDTATEEDGDTGGDSIEPWVGGVSLPPMVQNATNRVTVKWLPFVDDDNATQAHDIDYTVALWLQGSVGVGSPMVQASVTGDVAVAAAAASADGAMSHVFGATGVVDAGETYVATVTAVDVAGNAITAHAVSPLVVDDTAPTFVTLHAVGEVAAVRDGLDEGVDWDCVPASGVDVVEASSAEELVTIDLRTVATTSTADHSVVSAHWDALQDSLTGIAAIDVCVGTAPLQCDVAPFTSVASKATAAQILLPLLPEQTLVYTTVRATNGAGVAASFASDGQRVLCAPGSPGCDFDGFFMCLQ